MNMGSRLMGGMAVLLLAAGMAPAMAAPLFADQGLTIPAAKVPPGASMVWDRQLALTDEFLVQLAVRAGVDPARADRMRLILARHRAALRDIARSPLDVRRRTQAARTARDEKLHALLGLAEALALDEEQARFLAADAMRQLYGAGLLTINK